MVSGRAKQAEERARRAEPAAGAVAAGEPEARRRGGVASAVLGIAALYGAALLILSLIPVPRFVHDIGASSAAHVLAYGLPIFILFPLARSAAGRGAILAGVWLFGAAIEGAQALISWRSGSWQDVAENTLGIAGGAAVYVAAEWVVRLLARRRGPRGR